MVLRRSGGLDAGLRRVGVVDMRTFVFAERPDLHRQADEIFGSDWPEFIFHDPVAGRYLEGVREYVPEPQLLLVDGDDRIVAGGWGVPMRWNGSVEDLQVVTKTCEGAFSADPDEPVHDLDAAGRRSAGSVVADPSPDGGPAERSVVMTGSVVDWERWAGMPFPDSGSYVVPGALAPVMIDRRHDRGELVEPNVWVRHR